MGKVNGELKDGDHTIMVSIKVETNLITSLIKMIVLGCSKF